MKTTIVALAACLPQICVAGLNCKSMSNTPNEKEKATVEICIQQGTFAHDIYTVKLNGSKVVQDIDDNMIQFSGALSGRKLTGGCAPNIKEDELGGRKISIEVSRTCKVSVDAVEIGMVEFKFD